MAKNKSGAAAPVAEKPAEQVEPEVQEIDLAQNGAEPQAAPAAEAPAEAEQAAPVVKEAYDLNKLPAPKPGEAGWLKPGTRGQHRHTGEVFEVRKDRGNGQVVVKIARTTDEKGEHFNTYTVKVDNIVPVGSPVEEKPAPAPKAAKEPKAAKGPAATKSGKAAAKGAAAPRQRAAGDKTFMVELRPDADADKQPIRLKVDATDEESAKKLATEAVDARKGKSIPDENWQITAVREVEA